jgi:hypothetical protein
MKGMSIPYGETYADHRKVFGEIRAEKTRIRKVKKELTELFLEIFDGQRTEKKTHADSYGIH